MIYYSTFWNFYLWWEMLFWKSPLHVLFDDSSDFRTAEFSLVIFKRKSLHLHCVSSMLKQFMEKYIWIHNIRHEKLRIFFFLKFLIFIIIFCYFQVYNILVRQLCDLQSDPSILSPISHCIGLLQCCWLYSSCCISHASDIFLTPIFAS